MKITQSNVAMEGSSSKTLQYQVNERLETWAGARPQAAQAALDEEAPEGVLVDLQGEAEQSAQQAAQEAMQKAQKARPLTPASGFQMLDKDTLKLRLLEMMLSQLSGKRIKLFDFSDIGKSRGGAQSSDWVHAFRNGSPSRAADFGLEYDYHEVRIETEQVQFRANGAVQTEDGRTISFDVEMLLQRAEYEARGFSLRLGNAAPQNVCDPLVISYAGGAPELSSERHAFDLTMDGNDEQIAFAVNGSGFLALDKNGDGSINDGSELFGPQSGNGFQELAAYDMDGNGWIDENDAVFSQLRVLTLDQDGNRVLFSLGELGVGAIYLQNVGTQYDMKNGQDTQGLMRSSSVFLKENGEAGTIHHIDLTI